MEQSDNIDKESQLVEHLKNELAKVEPTKGRRIREKFILAILGSIPWVGGFLSAAASYKAEEGTIRQDGIQTEWLKEHEKKILLLKETISEVEHRFENLGSTIDERIQDESYLSLVRKAFRTATGRETA